MTAPGRIYDTQLKLNGTVTIEHTAKGAVIRVDYANGAWAIFRPADAAARLVPATQEAP